MEIMHENGLWLMQIFLTPEEPRTCRCQATPLAADRRASRDTPISRNLTYI